MERTPSPVKEFALPPECKKYFVSRAWRKGQSCSSRHWLAPITKSFTGFPAANGSAAPFKKIVVPAENGVVFFAFGGWAEIDVPDVASRTGVPTDGYDEALALPCRFSRAVAFIPT